MRATRDEFRIGAVLVFGVVAGGCPEPSWVEVAGGEVEVGLDGELPFTAEASWTAALQTEDGLAGEAGTTGIECRSHRVAGDGEEGEYHAEASAVDNAGLAHWSASLGVFVYHGPRSLDWEYIDYDYILLEFRLEDAAGAAWGLDDVDGDEPFHCQGEIVSARSGFVDCTGAELVGGDEEAEEASPSLSFHYTWDCR